MHVPPKALVLWWRPGSLESGWGRWRAVGVADDRRDLQDQIDSQQVRRGGWLILPEGETPVFHWTEA